MTRILIVDDNEQNLYLLESILKGYRYQAIRARNGAEALLAAEDSLPDLIITDILMPVMDGFELCRRWKADERLRRIPFMLYTATYTDPGDELLARDLGADRFVIKPQKPEILGRMIGELLAERKGEPSEDPVPSGTDTLRRYSGALFRKLEKKVKELEAEAAERRNAEEKFSRSESRYRNLYESMMDAFVSTDMKGIIKESNQPFRSMLGFLTEEPAGRSLRDLTPEKWQNFEDYIIESQVLAHGYSGVYEKEFRRRDGTLFPAEVRTTLLRTRGGEPAGMWMIVRDISERRQAEERIRLANRKLALMNEIAYQDIQNKVTALRGFAALVRERTQEPELLAFIDREQALLVSIHELIKKTKDYQQMGTDQSRWIPVDETLRQQMALQSKKGNGILSTDLRRLEIYADPLIDRVFYNLIHNALRHGGTVSRIAVSCRETSDGIVIFCEDDGIGIPADEKAGIFDRIVGGEGRFGLFFVREFLTLSGMTIRETGVPGAGARFEIFVPGGAFRFPPGL